MFGLPFDELILNRTMTAEVIFNLSDKYSPETEVSFRVKILLNNRHYLSSIFVSNGGGIILKSPSSVIHPFLTKTNKSSFLYLLQIYVELSFDFPSQELLLNTIHLQ